ncbi:membrane alanyl aminopeptidase [Jatrophihabitans sp. GAS493]|uniref:aminopeptidase N n=1 Tax=Jatrophihabitans sp. GAS493 TaxID=1907575 RepID=UPI000BB70212|nr:aminopeptidase N [Jatrophihabitans sp. GAS493]SOD71422.1 membrane alanyl aminopeptidase [Jatrophihabitans sp. GAS493]
MSLTRVEALRRAELLTVHRYRIELDLTLGEDVFGSATLVRFGCSEPGTATFIEIHSETLLGVVLNGVDIPAAAEGSRIELNNLQAENELLIRANLPYSRTGEGVHRFTDPADGQTYVGAYGGSDVSQHVFACFDQPDLKAVLEVSAIAPPDWTVVSNGLLAARDAAADRWSFAPTPPLSPYLFVLVAGPLHSVTSEHAQLPFALYSRASLAEQLDAQAPQIFAITHACFDRYAELFDEPYPYDSYDQAFVPGLNWGAMETPGCVTFRDELLFQSAVTGTEEQSRAMVIAHEMAHMWFGDLVTMRWWDDLWLSESFAEYMGFEVTGQLGAFSDPWTDFAMARKTWAYDADQRPTTHPVAPAAEDVGDTDAAFANFDGISYAKGASVLRQLAAWLGDEAFQAGINHFITRHRFASATHDDLFDSLALTSGLDVHAWAAEWIRTSGVERLSTATTAAGNFVVRRQGSRPYRLSVQTFISDTEASLQAAEVLPVDISTDETLLPLPAADPKTADRNTAVMLNVSDENYCKLRLDADSWATLSGALSSIPQPITRAVLWTTARDMVRDGDLPPTEYIDLVGRQLPLEVDPAIVRSVLAAARYEVIDWYLLDAERDESLAVIAEVCARLRAASATSAAGTAGSDLRLVALRVLIDSLTSSDSVAQLPGWLAAGRVPDGPVLDPDLRWRIQLRLAVLGARSADDITAELQRDRSSIGHEGALRCRAARPDLEAKEAAWSSMFARTAESGQLSARQFTAAGQGLWWPEQRSLTSELVPRFFPAAAETAQRRGPQIAKILGNSAFPRHAASGATLAALDACLSDPSLSPALRRHFTDRMDDLGRALFILRSPRGQLL